MNTPVEQPIEPEWLQVLRNACKGSSQSDIAKRLGVSGSTISTLLNGTYHADTARMESRVRGELMRETVQCPVMGEITLRLCVEEQQRPYYPDPIASALFRTCKTCPNLIPRKVKS